MEVDLQIVSTVVGILGGLSLLWWRITKEKEAVTEWRAKMDMRVERLEDGKDRLFDKMDTIEEKLDGHVVACAKDKAETNAKLDAMAARVDALVAAVQRVEDKLEERK